MRVCVCVCFILCYIYFVLDCVVGWNRNGMLIQMCVSMEFRLCEFVMDFYFFSTYVRIMLVHTHGQKSNINFFF